MAADASSLSSYRIESLTKDNYDTWRLQAQAILIKNNLWDYVTGEKIKPETHDEKLKWERSDICARSDLMLIISPSELKQVKNCSTSKDVWDTLQNIFQSRGPARKATLLKKLILTKMEENSDVRLHLNNFMDVVDKLEEMEVNINDDLLSIMMLYSLSTSFENFRVAIETRDILPKPEALKIKIIEESEARNKSSLNSTSEGAFYNKKPHKKFHKGTNNYYCKICNKSGHSTSHCRNNKNNQHKKSFKTSNNNAYMMQETCLLTNVNEKQLWCLDSGSTSHMCSKSENFIDIANTECSPLQLASSSQTAPVQGKGMVKVKLINDDEITLINTLHVPDLTTNLLSVSKFTDKGLNVIFTKNYATVKHPKGEKVLKAKRINNLYYVVDKNLKRNDVSNQIYENDNKIIMWHQKLGHVNENDIKLCHKNELLTGLDINMKSKLSHCETCAKGKLVRLPFPISEERRSKEPLEIVHSDVCGPMRVKSPGGARYFVTFIDDYTRYTRVYFMSQKNEVLKYFKEYKAETENFTGKSIKYLQSDNGIAEYCNREFDNFLKYHGIQRRLSATYTPQQNGVAERKNRTLLDRARCLLIDGNLTEIFWAEAINTANYLSNRLPTKILHSNTPFQKWVGRIPSVRHLHIFGTKCFILNNDKNKGKFCPRGIEGIFMGYSEQSKAYRIWVPKHEKIIVSRNVKVMKNMYYEIKQSKILQLESQESDITVDLKTKPMKGNEINEENILPFQDRLQDTFQETPCTNENIEEINEPNLSNRPQRTKTLPKWTEDHILYNVNEENIYQNESDDDGEWHDAIKSEIKAHIKNDTWKVIKKEGEENVIDSKMVLKRKTDSSNTETKKARLVARGFHQRHCIDYFETFAPVAKLSSIRLLLATAVENDLQLNQFDVQTAFLNGNLEEHITMKMPDYIEKYLTEIILEESSNEDLTIFNKAKIMLQDIRTIKGDKLCKLQKALYGLKQAGRQWYKKLDLELTKIGFKASQSDPCIYTYIKGGDKILMAIYVDDLIVAYSNKEKLNEIKNILMTKFQMKDLGYPKYCIGIEIKKEEDGLKLTQEMYIDAALKRFNMQECKPISTPIEIKLKLEKKEICENLPYQNLIGTLMYLAVATRPDIMYAISYLSQFNNCFGEEHFKCAKRVLRYLKGTKTIGIKYTKSNTDLYGLADADWAGCIIDRKSYTGYCFKYATSCISWESRKQKSVALSTAEAEYVSLSEAAKEAIHLKGLLSDMGVSQDNVRIYNDNQAAKKLTNNPIVSKKSKHIDIKLHFIREFVQQGLIKIDYMQSELMEADLLTKGLSGPTFEKLRRNLGII